MGSFSLKKLALTCTPDPIRPARQGPDPNRAMYGSKERGHDLGGFVREVWSSTALEPQLRELNAARGYMMPPPLHV